MKSCNIAECKQNREVWKPIPNLTNLKLQYLGLSNTVQLKITKELEQHRTAYDFKGVNPPPPKFHISIPFLTTLSKPPLLHILIGLRKDNNRYKLIQSLSWGTKAFVNFDAYLLKAKTPLN